MKNLLLFLFALIAAVGNAMFAAGQKKAIGINNSLVVIALSASVCLILTMILLLISGGGKEIYSSFTRNWQWIILSGCGLFLTYLGFNLLYSRFGTSSYIFYAVLSVITTSFIVGVLIFRENLNFYHLLSGITAVISILLFSLGNSFR